MVWKTFFACVIIFNSEVPRQMAWRILMVTANAFQCCQLNFDCPLIYLLQSLCSFKIFDEMYCNCYCSFVEEQHENSHRICKVGYTECFSMPFQLFMMKRCGQYEMETYRRKYTSLMTNPNGLNIQFWQHYTELEIISLFFVKKVGDLKADSC